ncbi:HAMP domain-containing sensor histidine kinase [Treponema sp.]|uniref:HAMP domain-containing sensor histidine kinase n=1 Tax=Treponema sp. TaxID=166 RepID=UPI003F04E864
MEICRNENDKNIQEDEKNKIRFQLFAFIAIDLVLWFLTTLFLFEVLYRIFGDNPFLETKLFSLLDTVFCAVLLVVFIIPFLHYLVRKIDNPVQYLIYGLKEISLGNYECRLNKITGNEFDEIYSAFNSMGEKLQKAEIQNEKNTKERTLLFANMAHDLKTPITTVQGFSQAILDGMYDSREKEIEYVKMIQKKAHLMNHLVDRLFEYVKLENPEHILHLEEADLAEEVRTAIANLYTEFEERQIHLLMEIPDRKIMCTIDRLETERVISNLLNNILVHNPEKIAVLVKLTDDRKLVIADSGKPVPPEIENHLFCPFISGDESRQSKNGSGLGLAIAQRIMEKQKGRLSYIPDYPGYTKAFELEF